MTALSIEEARRTERAMRTEIERWRGELWRTHGGYAGVSFDGIVEHIEALQVELDSLRAILDTRLRESATIVFGD